jgi:acyl-CoA reductase-like NAD-dependent aldehyde dehydrogenase/nicotinamidase-related amidase
MSSPAPRTALLLVDLQHDFLARPGLIPDADALCARAARLLGGIRRAGLPVVHAHTLLSAAGTDRMPHWQRRGLQCCVEGTPGAQPPPTLVPLAGELVLRKRYFSAFGDPRLVPWLREREISRLLVGGIFLHSCVRSTVLDAYERGYDVVVADDAVGSTEPLHGELTRVYLAERAADFRRVDELLADLCDTDAGARPAAQAVLPIATIAGEPRRTEVRRRFSHRNPCRTAEVLAEIPLGGAAEVEEAARVAAAAAHAWARVAPASRADCLDRWAGELHERRGLLADLIVREIGKPRRFVEEEVGRAVAHVRIAAELARDPQHAVVRIADGASAAHRPLGVVGLVTPWNNPLAIPVGKIAPALAFGNGVVFKPAPQASLTALAIIESLSRAGLPPGIVNVVLGDADATRALCRNHHVAAVSVTGSVATGRSAAAFCAEALKPLQAELGGNNAAIVLRDVNLEDVVPGLARAAFGFAGQRCTATRRFVVEQTIAAPFASLMRDAARALVIGEPRDATTEVGPLISAEKRDLTMAVIAAAVRDGARLVDGGFVPDGLTHGAWLAPALLTEVEPRSRIAQEETFAPVAIILPARDLDEAIAIANDVPQGLVLSVHTRDADARARVLEAAQAGIVQLGSGRFAVHPRAPFLGWKASGLGPPEHGVWDAAFYSRAQAVYEDRSC